MTETLAVRPAAVADVPWLLTQLQAFDRFYGTRRSLVPSDPIDATRIVTALVATVPFFVAETGRGPVGFIAGVVGAHPFNPELRVLQELLWWVIPSARGSSAGGRLLAVFEAYGRTHADWIVLTLEHESPIADRSLLKRGYGLRERSFLLEV